jgi:two-component system, NarL family, nitrate/nitrite response regulator NarL
MPIRVAILDDHQIVLDGLRLLLTGETDIEMVLEHTHGRELIADLALHSVDIVLSDMMMPDLNGYDVCKQVRATYPNIKLIVLSMNGEGELAEKLIGEVKVEGYVLKTANKDVLLKAIRTVFEGSIFYDPEVIQDWNQYKKLIKSNEEIRLTQREIEIIGCIAKDWSNKQIAENLFISERTVETHRKNILRKTNTHTALALVDFAKQRKLI